MFPTIVFHVIRPLPGPVGTHIYRNVILRTITDPEGSKITAIDFSPHMLARARAKAAKIGSEIELL